MHNFYKVLMEQIYGYVERITFQNIENGYTVAQLKQEKKTELTCIVGHLPGIRPGESIRCFGEWKSHLVHGKQFEVSSFKVEAPADIIGIKKYLGSGLIKGIGPKYANRIVEKFGIHTLHIIDQSPEKLSEITGLGEKRIEKIKTCWETQKSVREVMVFLQTYGITPALAHKIFRVYGEKSIAKVKENPFHLARDIFGVGFKTADTLAQKMGIAKDDSMRIDAGIEYVLSELSGSGHVCYPVVDFLTEAEKVLEAPSFQIEPRLLILQNDDRIKLADLIEQGQKRLFIWIKSLYLSEMGIARELKRIKQGVSRLRQIDREKALAWVQEHHKIQLAENQSKAVDRSISGKLHIITGGPGTGKSTITKAILAITEKLTSKICLAAPTGRAAKRMSEITGKKATTIHSLLEPNFKEGGFKRNRQNPIDCDLLIVDEASMIDTSLMYSLLRAIPEHARVIFVGDIHQLPSVGPGNVLKDMIGSHSVSVTTLNEIFRQAAGSHIITNAHKINNGIFPSLHNGLDSDFFFLDCQENVDVLDTIVKLTAQRLPNRYNFNPIQDIQILAPMKKGIIGTENLNQSLQRVLNPRESSLLRGNGKLQEGDKVMQIRNNYKKEVFNGDIGYIETIDNEEQQVFIRFEDKHVVYEYTELDEIVLAYAISIHKFQGSECLCVVIPVHTSHFMMLHRNLLYTGITRGKELVVLVGTKKAIAIAVKNNEVQNRYTALRQAIMEIVS